MGCPGNGTAEFGGPPDETAAVAYALAMVDALPEHTGDDTLQVRRTRWARWVWVPVLAVLVGVGIWYAASPAPLPTGGGVVVATTPVATPVYIGVLARAAGENRSIRVRDVAVETTGGEADVVALICRGSTFAVTTAPEAFCSELTEAVGDTLHLGSGDSLVLSVEADDPSTYTISEVQLSYRHGLQWDTQRVGPLIEVTVLTR